MITQIDHIAIAVTDLERAIETYTALFGRRPGPMETIPEQGVRLACFWIRNFRVELISPIDATSSTAKFMAKRGEGLHHVAFRVDDLKAAITECKQKGFRLLTDTPQKGGDGCHIVFMHPKELNGVLVELVAMETADPPQRQEREENKE